MQRVNWRASAVIEEPGKPESSAHDCMDERIEELVDELSRSDDVAESTDSPIGIGIES